MICTRGWELLQLLATPAWQTFKPATRIGYGSWIIDTFAKLSHKKSLVMPLKTCTMYCMCIVIWRTHTHIVQPVRAADHSPTVTAAQGWYSRSLWVRDSAKRNWASDNSYVRTTVRAGQEGIERVEFWRELENPCGQYKTVEERLVCESVTVAELPPQRTTLYIIVIVYLPNVSRNDMLVTVSEDKRMLILSSYVSSYVQMLHPHVD